MPAPEAKTTREGFVKAEKGVGGRIMGMMGERRRGERRGLCGRGKGSVDARGSLL